MRSIFFFFFNDPAPPEFYPLSLHSALPISLSRHSGALAVDLGSFPLAAGHYRSATVSRAASHRNSEFGDRKSTRLNSSHLVISYAVFCLKKKIMNVFLFFIL